MRLSRTRHFQTINAASEEKFFVCDIDSVFFALLIQLRIAQVLISAYAIVKVTYAIFAGSFDFITIQQESACYSQKAIGQIKELIIILTIKIQIIMPQNIPFIRIMLPVSEYSRLIQCSVNLAEKRPNYNVLSSKIQVLIQ